MKAVKRIFLYLITNLLVVATLSLVTNALGLHGYLTQQGIDYYALMSMCLVWGMGSSLIALLISRGMAKLVMGVQLIDSSTSDLKKRQLIQTVYQLARRAGLNTMPQVGIYKANELNAFATGPTRNRALIAVSSGLLTQMNESEVEGVLAHEISHITNGDMVTMTLLQGIVNAFSLFLSRILAYAVSNMLGRHDDNRRHHQSMLLYRVFSVIFDIVITLLGSLVVASFSRSREYRADKGAARLVGSHKMIAALERLRMPYNTRVKVEEADVMAPLKISRRARTNRLSTLLASHPDIDLRIAALHV